MKLSIKSKVILSYTLSPFFTGFILFFIYGIQEIFSNDEIGLISMLVGTPIVIGLFSLIIFFIPAMIVGFILYPFNGSNHFIRLVVSIVIGFIIPFTLFLPIKDGCSQGFKEMGGLLNCYYISRNMGLLGSITSFIVTLKLIFHPFKEK